VLVGEVPPPISGAFLQPRLGELLAEAQRIAPEKTA